MRSTSYGIGSGFSAIIGTISLLTTISFVFGCGGGSGPGTGSTACVSGTLVVGTVDSSGNVNPTSTIVSGATVWLEYQPPISPAGGRFVEAVGSFVQSTTSDGAGNFNFCSVTAGIYQIVADAMTLPGTAAPPDVTIAGDVSVSAAGGPTDLTIPIAPFVPDNPPALLSGQFSTANMPRTSGDAITFAATEDSALIPFLQIADSSGALAQTAVPGLAITSRSPGTNCPASNVCPSATNCACYTATVPSGVPVTGMANNSGNGYQTVLPSGDTRLVVSGAITAEARSNAGRGVSPAPLVCSPSSLTTSDFQWNPVGAVSVPSLNFQSCD